MMTMTERPVRAYRSIIVIDYNAINVNGKIIKQEEISISLYEYDRAGNLQETPDYKCRYNDKGQITEEVNIADDIKTVSKYDDRGSETEVKQYYLYDDGYEELIYQSESKYDENGRKIEFWFDSIDGMTEHHFYRYEYDDTGNVVKMYDRKKSRAKDARLKETVTVYEYRGKSLLAEKMYDTSTGLMLSLIKYDSNANVTEECTYDSNGNIAERNLYVYDRFNNVIKNESYTGTYLLQRTESEYVYDSENNWIQIVTAYAKAGEVTYSVIERKIEYY